MRSNIESRASDPADQPGKTRSNADQNGITILHAEPAPAIVAAIDMLDGAMLPNFRLAGPAALVADWLDQIGQTSDLLPAQAWLVADVAGQVRRFAEVAGATRVALKLEIIRDNACRKLHHDYVAYRLVCTYRGPGTQWLPRDCEPALGAERDAVPDEWLQSVPRFAGALFAGRLLPAATHILHRSPQIAGTGNVRLVLTINEPYASGVLTA